MALQLGILKDGGVILASDIALPDMVKRIEYYREQRLFVLVYDEPDIYQDDMMEYEIPEDMTQPIEASPNVIMMTYHPEDMRQIAYKAPLIKIGNFAQAA